MRVAHGLDSEESGRRCAVMAWSSVLLQAQAGGRVWSEPLLVALGLPSKAAALPRAF
jgi:hypothetical protein